MLHTNNSNSWFCLLCSNNNVPFTFTQNNNSENITNCKHYDLDEIQTLSKLNSKCTLSPFRTNSYSFSKNIEVLEYLLSSASANFDVNATSETKKPQR